MADTAGESLSVMTTETEGMNITQSGGGAFGGELLTVNFGPHHPSTHGVLRLVVDLDGEQVKRVQPVIGYLHTGIEKQMEALRWQQGVVVTDRHDYLSPPINNLAYALAVERLLGVEVPPRAKVLRVIMSELARLTSHLVWMGTSGLELGAMSMLMYCFRERDTIADMNEEISGFRMHTSYIRPGGVFADATPEPRSIGPVAPSTFASSAGRRPIPIVRRLQIGLSVSSASYSSTLPGILCVKLSSISRKRGVASANTPPGRMYDVCIRKPEISSNMSAIVSRSRNVYMSIDMAPSSSPLVPIHTRWEVRRDSSDMITRRTLARGGTSTPSSRSTASA